MELKLYACIYAFPTLTNLHPRRKVNNQETEKAQATWRITNNITIIVFLFFLLFLSLVIRDIS